MQHRFQRAKLARDDLCVELTIVVRRGGVLVPSRRGFSRPRPYRLPYGWIFIYKKRIPDARQIVRKHQ